MITFTITLPGLSGTTAQSVMEVLSDTLGSYIIDEAKITAEEVLN